ncbi:hypothetical protein [Stenotrophomonas sp. PD6]|uniref:hypothetical protein n=1 Tax=Stenotrophomonas sp. PD6 TaxID=3368612 RepID=UPI003BA0489A
MKITLQLADRRWRVLDPGRNEAAAFVDGAVAFDFADNLAREQHAETGRGIAVRVEVHDAFVDVVRYG